TGWNGAYGSIDRYRPAFRPALQGNWMGRAQETMSISVCALQATELEAVVQSVREAGAWGIVPIQWPNPGAFAEALRSSHALLLATQARPPDDLLDALAKRTRKLPVIAVGHEPARRANPSLWFASMPPTAMLSVVLRQLIDGGPEVDSGSQGI